MCKESIKGIAMLAPNATAEIQTPFDITNSLAIGQLFGAKLLAVATHMPVVTTAAKSLIWPNAPTRPAVMSLVFFLSTHSRPISQGEPGSHGFTPFVGPCSKTPELANVALRTKGHLWDSRLIFIRSG